MIQSKVENSNNKVSNLLVFDLQLKEFSCTIHNEPVEFICTENNCRDVVNCYKCYFNHTRSHENYVKKLSAFIKSITAFPLDPSDTAKASELNSILEKNIPENYTKRTLQEAKEKLDSVCHNILEDFKAILTSKKEDIFFEMEKQFETIKINLKPYNERKENLSNKNNTAKDLSKLIAKMNKCENTKKFEEMIVSELTIFRTKSSKLKEEAAELEGVAQSLLSQLKVNPSSSFLDLYDQFKKHILPTVEIIFDKAIGLKDKVGPIDLFVLEANTKTQTSDLTLKTEKQTQTSDLTLKTEKQTQTCTQTCTKLAKHARTAWTYYSLLNRPRCKAKNPNYNSCKITKILQSEWAKNESYRSISIL